jgi:large subunit ribosomal protein L33
MAKGKSSIVVFLECTETGDRNYTLRKPAKAQWKLELMKYSPKLRKHTLHKEKKK